MRGYQEQIREGGKTQSGQHLIDWVGLLHIFYHDFRVHNWGFFEGDPSCLNKLEELVFKSITTFNIMTASAIMILTCLVRTIPF
jgi:hypothetical protein